MLKNLIIRDASLTLATTDTTIAEQVGNGQRAVLTLKNTSTGGEIISIAVGTAASALKGIVLNQGDAYVMSTDGGYAPSNMRVSGVGSAATATLAIHEEIEVNW